MTYYNNPKTDRANYEASLHVIALVKVEEERRRQITAAMCLDGYDWNAMNEADLDKPRRTRPD
jgi:hypothetical protein